MIHIIMGLPGSGKTEAAKYLKKRLGSIRINTDDLYSHLYPDKKYIDGDFLPGRLEQVYNALGALAYYLETANPQKHYIFEGSFRYKSQRDHIVNQFDDSSKINTLLIEVANEREIKKRITERHQSGAPDTYEDYLKIKSAFEKPKNAYIFDNSGTLAQLKKKLDEYVSKF